MFLPMKIFLRKVLIHKRELRATGHLDLKTRKISPLQTLKTFNKWICANTEQPCFHSLYVYHCENKTSCKNFVLEKFYQTKLYEIECILSVLFRQKNTIIIFESRDGLFSTLDKDFNVKILKLHFPWVKTWNMILVALKGILLA